jgi:hypothetical protein
MQRVEKPLEDANEWEQNKFSMLRHTHLPLFVDCESR